MYAYLKGRLTYRDPAFVVLEVNGIGFQVKISLSTYSKIKEDENCKLFTYLHQNENVQTLFGFFDQAEKNVFLQLISVNGVGPGTAVVVLSSLSTAELQHAIVTEDVKTIQSVKGIGAKTAQRLILELKDKFKKDMLLDSPASLHEPQPTSSKAAEALAALVMLGIPKPTAEKTLEAILKKNGTSLTVEEMIKTALKS